MAGLDLSGEQVCKEKFKLWFDAGGWTVQDLTKADSAQFSIPNIVSKLRNQEDAEYVRRELLKFAKSIEFPHDGEATRGRFMFCFDYKYHRSTKYFIGAEKNAYDKYWGYGKPWFYLLIWAEDQQKRFTHQLQDPKNLELKSVKGYPYYDITNYCVDASKIPNVPVKIPAEVSDVDSLAYVLAINRWTEHNFNGDYNPTAEDLEKAKGLLSSKKFRHFPVRQRKWRAPKP